MRYGVLAALVLLFLILTVSGCTQNGGDGNETTEYEYYNTSENASLNETIEIPKGDFAFKIHGENEFWIPPNKSMIFYVVFNNIDDDQEKHYFIARVHPSAADFDVMAAYQCLHFTTCDKLIEDMESFFVQPEDPVGIDYAYVGLYTIEISIPSDAVQGTYLFNMVACQDKSFGKCSETGTNWGPNIPIIVHVFYNV